MAVEELVVTINDQPVFRFMGSRTLLLTRATELAKAGLGNQRFFIGGAELLFDTESNTVRPAPADHEARAPSQHATHISEPEVLDVEVVNDEVSETPQQRRTARADDLDDPRAREETLEFKDAVAISKDLLTKTVNLHERMLDRAAERSMKMLEGVSAQTQRALKNAVDHQEFVGAMNARLAEERLAAFRIRSAEEAQERREAAREYERQRAIAEASRPTPAMMLTEVAMSFAGHFAANAAHNFAVMNQPDPGADHNG